MISGKPVTSLIPIGWIPAASKALFVPPVEIISYPQSTRPFTNSTKPVLSDTLTNARFILFPPQYFLRLVQ